MILCPHLGPSLPFVILTYPLNSTSNTHPGTEKTAVLPCRLAFHVLYSQCPVFTM